MSCQGRVAYGDDRVDDGPCDISLVGEVDLDGLRAGPQQRNRIGVVFEANSGLRDIIGDDQIDALGDEFGGGVGDEIVGLRGEADEHLTVAFAGSETGQDVGRRFEHDLRCAVTLLQFAVGDDCRAEVGHGGGHHDDVVVVGRTFHRLLHLGRRLDAADGRTLRHGQPHGGHDRDHGPSSAASAAIA